MLLPDIISGTYQEGSHRILQNDACLLEDRTASAIVGDIRSLIKSFKLTVYNEKTGTGLIRRVLIRVGKRSGQVLVTLVAADPVFPGKKNFIRELTKKHPEITGVVLNINRRSDSLILGDRSEVVFGKGTIKDTLCGMEFRISPESFYQINPDQTEILYGEAMRLAGITKDDVVLDAYCGTGTIGLIASKNAGSVVGVENNPKAVKDAISNAKSNGAGNIRFVRDDATEFILREKQEERSYDVVILDPPRSGTTREFIEAVAAISPKRVVYISCEPATQARDLKIFREKGYHASTLIPVDMFPLTGHVETVCLLSKLSEAKHHIEVKVDMDELDLTSAEAKATYKEIQDWVQEKYGFHVTNLNIAQVKQKHGIIERENYNKPKTPDSKQPGCPEDKIKAIEDAMRNFQMI